MKIKGVQIYWLIFIGMVVGVVLGIAAVAFDFGEFIKDWITPLGDIFVRILSLIAIPLLFVSLIRGVINLESATKLASIAGRTIFAYTATTVVATIFAIVVVLVVRPGDIVSDETSQSYFGDFSSEAGTMIENVSGVSDRSPLAPIVDMIPNDIITPLSGGSHMLQALVLAIMIGVVIVTIKGSKLEHVRSLISDLEAILYHAVDMAMYIAPVGIMALMANVVVDSNGDVALLQALGLYTVTVVGSIVVFAFVAYPIMLRLFTKIKVRDYLAALLPVQLMAISTSSSAATLPTTMKVANETLGIPKSVTSFTLPMGVTINMDGSSIYLTITVIFIAQVLGIELTVAQIMTVIFTSIIASVGTPGIPGGVLVTVVMVLDSIGIPLESIALVIALVRPLDLFVTALNVTGDITVSAIVAASEDKQLQSGDL